LGHPDNYIRRDVLVTPTHIVPEWYFLIFYRILRLVPQKLRGVGLIGISIIRVLIFSISIGYRFFYLSKIKSEQTNRYIIDIVGQVLFYIFICVCILLRWIGAQVMEEPFLYYGKLLMYRYFFLGIVSFIFSKILVIGYNKKIWKKIVE
jgi:ubiquinol-cytochrome c reductase cytochrome b subunit